MNNNKSQITQKGYSPGFSLSPLALLSFIWNFSHYLCVSCCITTAWVMLLKTVYSKELIGRKQRKMMLFSLFRPFEWWKMCSQCVPRVAAESWLRSFKQCVLHVALGLQPENLMRAAGGPVGLFAWTQAAVWFKGTAGHRVISCHMHLCWESVIIKLRVKGQW